MQSLVSAYRLTGDDRAVPANAVVTHVLRPTAPLLRRPAATRAPQGVPALVGASAKAHSTGNTNGHADAQRVIPFGEEDGDALQTF